MNHKRLIPLFATCILVIVCSCRKQGTTEKIKVEYGYEGKFGVYGIADTARAFDGSVLIAKAKALEIIQKDPGPNHILIEEEHYGSGGDVIYKGTLEFRFGFGGGTLVAEKPITGKKRYNMFGGWPAGH